MAGQWMKSQRQFHHLFSVLFYISRSKNPTLAEDSGIVEWKVRMSQPEIKWCKTVLAGKNRCG